MKGPWGGRIRLASSEGGLAVGADRGLRIIAGGMRGLPLMHGAVMLASRRRMRSRPLYTAALLLSGGEWAWTMCRLLTGARSRDEVSCWVDTLATGAATLLCARALPAELATAQMNFARSDGYLVAAGNAVGLPPAQGALSVGILAASYLVGVKDAGGSVDGSIHLANSIMYVGIFGLWSGLGWLLRRLAVSLDEERAEATCQGEELAVTRERNRMLRLVHDRALQALEHLGTHYADDPRTATRFARGEARRLRRALHTGAVDGHTFLDALDDVAAEFEERGLRVELVIGEVSREPDPLTATAAVDSVREALTNVAKHAGVGKAVVRAVTEAGALVVSVRDHGSGFCAEATPPGFGIAQSIRARVADAGGRADIWSAPGRGTRVVVRIPG